MEAESVQAQTKAPHLACLWLFIALLLGVLLLLVGAAICAVTGVAALFQRGNYESATTLLVLAAGMTFSALLLLPACYYNLRHATHLDQTGELETSPRLRLSWLQVLPFLALWPLSLLVGQWLSGTPRLGWLILPLLGVLGVALPLWLWLGWTLDRLPLAPRWQVWSTFGIGMTLAPLLATIAELLVFALISLVGVLYLSGRPDLSSNFTMLLSRLMSAPNQEVVLRILSPYLLRPGMLLIILTVASVLIPLIEEALKPLAVWLLADQLSSPVQGFVLGILSGAGFALFENIPAVGGAGGDWAAEVIARACAALMHMTATGLVGWALVSAWQERRFLRLGLSYGLAVLIHGVWNALGLGVVWYSLTHLSALPSLPAGAEYAIYAGLLTMALGGLLFLRSANRRLRLETENMVR
jgi:RsiW-degrading membrane proteinase PrsW (M82 family)